MPDIDPTDVLPVNNLPAPSAPWGRAMEKRLRALEKGVVADSQDIAGQNRNTAATLQGLADSVNRIPVTDVFTDSIGGAMIPTIGFWDLPVGGLIGGGTHNKLSVLSSINITPLTAGVFNASLRGLLWRKDLPPEDLEYGYSLRSDNRSIVFGGSMRIDRTSEEDFAQFYWRVTGPAGINFDAQTSTQITKSLDVGGEFGEGLFLMETTQEEEY